MNASRTKDRQTAPFDEHAARTLGQLQHAFEAVVNELPDPIGRAADLQHSLKLDKVLSWRIFNVMRRGDPFAAARYVPGSSAVKNFLRAAQKRGVPPGVVESAAEALADFERLVVVHAGDRKRLDMMLASQAEEGRAETDLSYRRAAFQANTYLWGISASVALTASFASFSDSPGMMDAGGLRGFVGLQRTRADLRWPIMQPKVFDDEDTQLQRPTVEPFYDFDEPPPEVCDLLVSGAPLQIESVRLPKGTVRYDLMPGPVGRTAAITCITGGRVRQMGSYRAVPGDEHNGVTAQVSTPCELMVFDQFIDEDLFGRIQPELCVHSLLHDESFAGSVRLPVQETVRYLGKATGALHTPEIPRYADMVKYAFEKLGWDAGRFDVYRFRWEYPIIPTAVTMRNPLRPADGENGY